MISPINMSKEGILFQLKNQDPYIEETLVNTADRIRKSEVGNEVYLRGLIEFSNICTRDCFYCGIRKSNSNLKRYSLSDEEILKLAISAYQRGYYSICLQSGEVRSPRFLDRVAQLVKSIKEKTIRLDEENGITPPKGLGITLSLGELDRATYRRLFEAGGHRYLLRIETSNVELFQKLHPIDQTYKKRLECLYNLKEIGYQVGTGIMIGLPGQTAEDLYNDLMFFKNMDVDMIGMGPYIPHPDTPLYQAYSEIFTLEFFKRNLHWSIKMIALVRIMMPDINIVASTALQTIDPSGLPRGLKAGANVVMPVLTPPQVRDNYLLYENKLFREEKSILEDIKKAGYSVGLWKWGDPLHFFKQSRI